MNPASERVKPSVSEEILGEFLCSRVANRGKNKEHCTLTLAIARCLCEGDLVAIDSHAK
jgi:hypothetical protein